MRIVLVGINGSYQHSNLAIRRLREPLEREGFEVMLFEGTLRDTDAALLDALYRADAAVYGFSCYIWNRARMTDLAANLRTLRPGAKILFGGPEVTYDAESFASLPQIDCAVRGPGETVLPRLCRMVLAGNKLPKTADGGDEVLSNGILYREDETAFRTLYYESSVGCPFSCAYCLSSATNGVKYKPVDQVLGELAQFEDREGDPIVKFVDRTFNADPKRAEAIWEGILANEFRRRYQFEICASLLTDDAIRILSRFPNGQIQLEAGLQSTNPETVRAVARHLDTEKTLARCRELVALGSVHVHLDLIAGLPYEDYASFAGSFNDAYPCCHLLQLGFLKLLHGTALRRDAETLGIRYRSDPPYTVLSTPWISYPELRRLETISDLMERFRDSGHFNDSLAYLIPHAASPFSFYEGLADHIAARDGRTIRKIGQADAYRLLYSYGMTLPGIADAELTEVLHADFTSAETRRAPRFRSDPSD